MRLPGLWRARMAVAMTATALAAGIATSGPARAASPDESRLLALSNGLRASVDAPALAVDESLSAVARAWAARMAAAGAISHNPDLAAQVSGWSKLAENVGTGPDVDAVHRALVASRFHHANLVDPAVTLVGIGVVRSGGTVFVVENFLGRSGAPAPPPAQHRPAPTPATLPPAAAAAAAATASAPPPPPTTTPARGPARASTPAVVAAPPPAPVAPAAPSPWLVLALEVTRGWERATG